jgi:DNA-binding transcriptional LysR family regulator
MPRPSLTELDAALAIARKGSFRAAALDLGLSTTALSNALGKLEQQLGVRLFNRTTRSVSLTDAGRAFIEQVGPAMADIHSAMNAAQALQETPTGTLRINAFASAAREVLAPLVLPFLQRFPQVQIDIVTEGRIVDIVAEGFDMGIRPADLVPSDMIAVPLGGPRRNAVVATPDYFRKHGRPSVPLDLLAHACIRVRLPNGSLYRWRFDDHGSTLQIDVQGCLTLDETSLSRAAALEGAGIGFLMEADVEEDIAAGRLERVLHDWMPVLSPICLYYPGRKNPPAAFTAFVRAAREFGLARQAGGAPRQ